MYFSYGDFPFFVGYIRSANSILERPELSLSTTFFLFVLSLSFIGRISRSIFPFSRWSLTGHSTCFISIFWQNYSNRLLRNIVAGSVLIFYGIPCLSMYLFKNSITFSVVGFLKNFATQKNDRLKQVHIYARLWRFGTALRNRLLFLDCFLRF